MQIDEIILNRFSNAVRMKSVAMLIIETRKLFGDSYPRFFQSPLGKEVEGLAYGLILKVVNDYFGQKLSLQGQDFIEDLINLIFEEETKRITDSFIAKTGLHLGLEEIVKNIQVATSSASNESNNDNDN